VPNPSFRRPVEAVLFDFHGTLATVDAAGCATLVLPASPPGEPHDLGAVLGLV
jgi:hypothetical protein